MAYIKDKNLLKKLYENSKGDEKSEITKKSRDLLSRLSSLSQDELNKTLTEMVKTSKTSASDLVAYNATLIKDEFEAINGYDKGINIINAAMISDGNENNKKIYERIISLYNHIDDEEKEHNKLLKEVQDLIETLEGEK